MQKEANKKEQALNISIKEGSAASVATGIAETQITPFALAIQASSFQRES